MRSFSSSRRTVLRPGQVRGANRAVVLQLLRGHEPLSRAQLARQTGLSEGSVSRIAAELISLGLVTEDGEENSTGGRPATRLRLAQSRLAVGVDIHDWEVRFSIATMGGQLLDSRSFRTPSTPDGTLELIVAEFTRLRTQYGRERLEGVGISTRGIVNSRAGVVELGANPKWVQVPIRHRLQPILKTPVYVDNNVRLGALAEYHYGRLGGDDCGCLIFVKVDEGIGMGLVFDGRVYHGARLAAGEFGQMIIGRRGSKPETLEQLASDQALCSRYAALRGDRRSGAARATTGFVRRICHLAMTGDGVAERALRQTARNLGIGIANVVWGLDPDIVVVDSSYPEAWPVVAEEIQAQFPGSEQLRNFRGLQLRPSQLRGEAAMIGAATLPFMNVFATGERTQLPSAEA
jgi:predicted NBD/HSP70 family sugar kinase